MAERFTKSAAILVARALEEMARGETAPGTKAILERSARLLRSGVKGWNARGDNGNKKSAAPQAEARSLRGQALSEDSTGALSPSRPADDITVRLDNLAQSLAHGYPISPDTLVDLAEAASLIARLRSSDPSPH